MAVNVTYGRMRQLPPRRVGGWAARTGAAALAIACLLAAVPAGAATQSITVNGKPIYTPTGVTVHTGDTVTITASGKISFGGGPIKDLGPAGIPWGDQCDKIANPRFRSIPWPLRGSPCWSLIGRIGLSKPIEIGLSKTFTADRDGPLFLGVNEGDLTDNTGTFDVAIEAEAGSNTPR